MKSIVNLNKQLFQLACITLLISVFSVKSNAQATAANYSYDANGNRIKRKVGVSFARAQNIVEDSTKSFVNGISVYPNPSNDKINVAVTSASENKKAVVTLMDNAGRILSTKEVNSSDPFPFDISKYNPGIYFIDVLINKERLSYQVVKTY
jgi:hypothetical protein